MNALTAADDATDQQGIRRLYRPGVLERGLKIIAQECEGRPERAAIAQRIAGLLREREANQKAMRAASARFNPPATPAPTVTYRGPFGPIEIDVDGDWIRELLPDFSPRSRRGKRLRKLLWSTSRSGSRPSWKPWRKRLAACEAIASATLPCRPPRCSPWSSAPTTTASARQRSSRRCLRSPARRKLWRLSGVKRRERLRST
jgi:hypothetical protein